MRETKPGPAGMNTEQEGSHLEWPDHTLHPHVPCRTLTISAYPSSVISLGSGMKSLAATKHHTCDTGNSCQEVGKLGARGFSGPLSSGSPAEDNSVISLQQCVLSHVRLCNPWTIAHQRDPVIKLTSQWGHYCLPALNRLPPLGLRRGWKMFSRPNRGEVWPLSKIQALRAFWDSTTAAVVSVLVCSMIPPIRP